MEKKEYIKPSVEVNEMEPVQMIAASAKDIPVVGGDGQGLVTHSATAIVASGVTSGPTIKSNKVKETFSHKLFV